MVQYYSVIIQEFLSAMLWMGASVLWFGYVTCTYTLSYTLYCTVSFCTTRVTHYCGKPLLYLGTIWYSIILYSYMDALLHHW